MFIEKNIDEVFFVMNGKGYKFFTSGNYNLNLIGIRKNDCLSNVFDDLLLSIFKVDSYWRCHIFQITTDPGLFWLENPINVNGTAILKPGQYIGAFKLGRHKNQYPALVQCKPVTVYRDRNKDNKIDTEIEDTGMFGINIHKAGIASKTIDKWSAGCQAFANEMEYNFHMQIIYEAVKIWGDVFSYTLLEQKDFKEIQI